MAEKYDIPLKEAKIRTYLKDIMGHENDYHDIIQIIVEYYKQGFAEWFDENNDKDYEEK